MKPSSIKGWTTNIGWVVGIWMLLESKVTGELNQPDSSSHWKDPQGIISEENNFMKSAQTGYKPYSKNDQTPPTYPNFSTSSQFIANDQKEGSKSKGRFFSSDGNEPQYYQNIVINTCDRRENEDGPHPGSPTTNWKGLIQNDWNLQMIGTSLCAIPRSEDKKTWNQDAKSCLDPTGNFKIPGSFHSQGSNVVLEGTTNGWMLHAPNGAGHKGFYIVPRTADRTDWAWAQQTRFDPDGVVYFSNEVYHQGNIMLKGASNGWILHAPNDGRKTFYLAPQTPDRSGWAWNQQTRFEPTGDVFFSGFSVLQRQANCNLQRDTVGPRGITIAAEDDHVYMVYKDAQGQARGVKFMGGLMGDNCAGMKII